ncbi:hypothetical protein K503DRAFT_497253 [Rhizopogon vinicolor AM-OR11-026]|uniref:Uncharacterized protein n=1 Tax=Rhizopogon vinicolor AM-OR11-026 TaxID=1314800 RepID=A0A1B7MMA3_9AGAM|nr:hypothetical protein K503DRAFT_497253 [Rhizopogon vinicolor AM-OR11-026]
MRRFLALFLGLGIILPASTRELSPWPLKIGIGNSSGAVAAMVYRTQDLPRFILGHGVGLMFIGIRLILIFVPIVVLLYKRINAQRLSRQWGEKVQYSDQELREMEDRAPDFRHTL